MPPDIPEHLLPSAVPDDFTWSEAVLEAVFDQAPFLTGILSPEGRIIKVGRSSLASRGYSFAEVRGLYFWDAPTWRGSPDTQARIKAAFAAAVERGERFQATLPFRSADGAPRWTDFSLAPVHNPAGELMFVVALGNDVTTRVRAETELTAIRKRLDSTLLAAELGTYEWNVVADRLHADPNLARIFGIQLDAEGAAPLADFLAVIPADERGRVADAVAHSVATGENFEQDYRIMRADGSERWVNSRGRMVRDAGGRVVTFVGVVMDITARKRAEQEREAIAVRLRRLTVVHETVLSGITDFAYVFDLEGRFLYANPPLLKLYGRTLEEVVGRTFSQLGYPAWLAEQHLREIAQVIASRQSIQGEVPFQGESGMSGIYDYIFTPVFAADGHVEAVAGTTRDVSERKRGEARDRLLVAADDATRPLTDPAAITLAAARMLGETLGASRCAYADVEDDENTFNLTGDFNRDVPSIVGRYRFDQFGDECLRLMRAGEAFVVNDAETDPRTAAVRAAYRATKIRAVICVPLRKAGRFVAAMAVHQDTVRTWLPADVDMVFAVANRSWESIERSRVVRVLAESEERLSLAIATGRLGVWEMNLPAGEFQSSALCRVIYGRMPGQDFTYPQMTGAVHPADRARVQATIERSHADGGDYDIEHRVVWPDQTVHWVLVRGQTRLGPDRQPQRMIGVTTDITARKEAEREQIRLRDEALRASRAKDDFLATLSHELRTPLNPVLLIASEAARDPGLADETRESFEIIRRNVELEARLIDDLLDLTSIVRGKLTIRKEARDLHAILADAVAAVQPEFEAKGIALNVSFGARKPLVFVDEVRIAQVFINLLKNAAKFTPGKGCVTLQTALDGSGGIVVRLTDSGIGMTDQELDRVFDAFAQGDHAAEGGPQRFGGLGIGLAISRRLVELHGGQIAAVSGGRGRGASFSVTLPLRIPAEGEAGPGHPAPSPAAPPLQLGETRILLVEDHAATRRTLEQLLQRRGYQVVAAGSVAEAREHAAAREFDLVLSDLGLPDGDGTGLMRELRDERGLKGVALTGYGMDEDIERCRAAGFVTHLTKPIRVEALEAALREALASPKP